MKLVLTAFVLLFCFSCKTHEASDVSEQPVAPKTPEMHRFRLLKQEAVAQNRSQSVETVLEETKNILKDRCANLG